MKSSEKSNLTYEKLMSSNFIKFPSHSPVVHFIFNPFMVALIIFVVVTAYIKIADGDWTFALYVAAICSLFVSMKFAMVVMQLSGHGVGIIKKGRFSIFGLPTKAALILCVPFIIILFLAYLSFTASADDMMQRVQILSVSLIFSYVMATLSWRFHTYYTTWYGDEYAARMEFKNKGYTPEEIEEGITTLKQIGILAD